MSKFRCAKLKPNYIIHKLKHEYALHLYDIYTYELNI